MKAFCSFLPLFVSFFSDRNWLSLFLIYLLLWLFPFYVTNLPSLSFSITICSQALMPFSVSLAPAPLIFNPPSHYVGSLVSLLTLILPALYSVWSSFLPAQTALERFLSHQIEAQHQCPAPLAGPHSRLSVSLRLWNSALGYPLHAPFPPPPLAQWEKIKQTSDTTSN